MASSPQIINPLTPLAYLPPSLADQLEASRYLYVATLGAFLWDWLMAIPDEYRLLTKASRRLPLFVYFLSRVSALAYILTSTLFQIARIPDCGKLQLALALCYCFAVSSTSFLFYLRIQAVFHRSKFIQGVFGVLWLGVLGGSITVPLAIRGVHIEPTSYCVNSEVKSFASTAVIMTFINDSLVFFAISIRLLPMEQEEQSFKARVKLFFGASRGGGGLTQISKVLFQGGQIYYLTTVSMNLLAMVMVLTPSAPPIYRAMFTIPNNALQNAMACRVFRGLRLNIIPALSGPGTAGQAASLPLTWRPSQSQVGSTGRGESGEHGMEGKVGNTYVDPYLGIKVTRDIEMARDDDLVPARYKPSS